MLQEIPSPSSLDPRTIVLETERLVLRQPTLADVKGIARIVGDKRVAINLRRVPHPYTLDDAANFVAASGTAMHESAFLIEHSGTIIGLASLTWDARGAADVPELGYCLGFEHWGQGFATEAIRAVIDYGFNEFAVTRMVSGARVLNPASRHVLEKCGFQWTGVELHRFLALGGSTPVDRFRLERSIWASLKGWSDAIRHS